MSELTKTGRETRGKAAICLITTMHPSLNPRLVKEADALSEAGYRVSVIAPNYSAWALQADAVYDARAWQIVARPQYGPGAPPLTRMLELGRRAAAETAVRLGIMFPSVVRAAVHPSSPLLLAAARRHRADLYIAHVMPALPAAASAAAAHRALYAFDAEDFHLGEPPPDSSFDLQRRLTRATEEPYLSGCAYVTAASPGIARAYADAYNIPTPTSLLNVFPKEQAPSVPLPKGAARPGPSVYWYSQTIGGDRGLQCAVRALSKSTVRPHLYLRGAVSSDMADELLSIAAECGVADQIHFLEPALPNLLETLAASFDIGLCAETGHTQNRKIALTNKLFSYLLAGVPVLLSDIPAHREFSQNAEGAVELFATDDTDSLARAMDSILRSTERLAAMRAAAWQLGQTRFNWDLEKTKLVDLVDRVLTRPPRLTETAVSSGGNLTAAPTA